MAASNPSVSLVFSRATLLCGGLEDCSNVDDPSCEGGIALIRALLRQHSDGVDEANLIINRLDYQSVFVQMHPLDWNVNRLILRDYFGLQTFWTNPSLMQQHQYDSPFSIRDLSGLQSKAFPPTIHGNVVVGTTNSWSQYVKNVHFDEDTGLATVLLHEQFISTGDISSLPPEEAARALMHYIAQENRVRGCSEAFTPYDAYVLEKNQTTVDEITLNQKCWIPVLIKAFHGPFEPFLDAVLDFEQSPAVLINIRTHDEIYEQPKVVGMNKIWVLSYEDDDFIARQVRISLDNAREKVSNVTILEHSLESFPNNTKDDELRRDVAFLRDLANEAQLNDPIQGLSAAMPVARVDDFRACFGGECPIGNLFTDALRWYTGADFAFIQSGGVRGEGWPAGPVRVSDLWSSLPFANTECTGMISGVTVFRLFELSTREAAFVSQDDANGDRLFQVSGLRYTYNTQSEAPRLVKLEILDKDSQEYMPVERLKLYKYATSSWMCSGFHPFPSILSDELLIQGEEPSIIGDQLMQTIVGEYFQFEHSDQPYNTTIQGRLVNDTNATTRLGFVQDKSECTSSSYWVEESQSCFDCPRMENLVLSGSGLEFESVSGGEEIFPGTVNVVNGEVFPVQVAFKTTPDWVTITTSSVLGPDGRPVLVTLQPGQIFALDYTVTAKDQAPGVATGALSFAVVDGGQYPGCVGRDLVLKLSQAVANSPEFSSEGSIRIVGFTMVAIVSLTSMAFAFWVYIRKEKKAVKMMQPTFLLAICAGVFVIGLSILSRSLVGWDQLSDHGHDVACMSNAWLLSMGFCLVVSALLAKLWRINKVAASARAFRRTNVSVKSAVLNFSIQFVLNFILMLIWTLVDPMTYEIKAVEGEEWKLYGTCGNMDAAGWTFLGLTIGMNFFILLLAVYQAYKARKLGGEYSESSGLGLALFCWLQLVLVVAPVLFLIEEYSVGPRYFLSVSLVFACCMSMLLFIFVPLMMKVRRSEREPSRRGFSNFKQASNRLSTSFRNQKRYISAPPDAMREETTGFRSNDDRCTKRAISMITTVPLREQRHSDGASEENDPTDFSTREVQELNVSSSDADSQIQQTESALKGTDQSETVHKRIDFTGEIKPRAE